VSDTPDVFDRRAALKARHRSAILEAARSLVEDRGGPRFSVDELAERADVARRTVFNHFASVDEVLLTLCADELEILVDDFVEAVRAVPLGDGTRASMFAETAQTLRNSDLPTAILRITKILGEPAPDDPRGRALSEEAFARAAERLIGEVSRRNPGADQLEVEFLIGSLMNGVLVIAKYWTLEVGLRLDSEARAEWQALLTRLIDSVRSGYEPTA
jgi:AcrR family transcriptional regulator